MEEIENINRILVAFKIKATCVSYRKIRNISLYDLTLWVGTRVKDIEKFSKEIALSLRSHTIPIIRMIPEMGIVRLEVVAEKPHKIDFFQEISKIDPDHKNISSMYLGSSVGGKDMWMDMAKNPNLLIAGTTGSGKSTLLHILIANALRDKNINICLVDTKNVEFAEYSSLEKINIATSFSGAVSMLRFLVGEMEMRYSELTKNNGAHLNPILFIIDEFADLVMQDTNKVLHDLLCRLAQKCRAAKIYCVLATQRPSVDIIKGAIKANFPARISCQVASHIDSKVILDATGAELLAGNGDAIIKNYNNNFTRFQIAHTTQKDIMLYGKN